jgi:hypothetical protein
MDKNLQILKAEVDGPDGVIVAFSDGTIAGFVLEELLALRPLREPIQRYFEPDRPANVMQMAT